MNEIETFILDRYISLKGRLRFHSDDEIAALQKRVDELKEPDYENLTGFLLFLKKERDSYLKNLSDFREILTKLGIKHE